MLKHCILNIIVLFTLEVHAQINIKWTTDDLPAIFSPVDSVYQDWKQYNETLEQLQFTAITNGYLAFSVDSLVKKDSTNYEGYINGGPQYAWASVKINQQGPTVPEYLQKGWKKKIVTAQHLSERLRFILSFFQNNGYPFAAAQLKNIKLNESELEGTIKVSPNELVQWDTLIIEGNCKLKKSYLQNYLGVHPKRPYSEALYKTANRKLRELPFVTVVKKPTLKFIDGKANLVLYLKHKSANFINGIVGVLPNSTSALTGDESQLVITGDLKLNLGNSFGYGEKIKFNWRRIQVASQQLETKEEIPYLFNSPIGVTHSLDLLRQDTTFINFKNSLGVKFNFDAKKSFTAFWENEFTNQLSDEPITQKSLSATSGSKNAYGLRINWDDLDYRFNPRKGINIDFEAKAGLKRIAGLVDNGKISLPIFSDNNISSSLRVPETSMVYESQILIEAYLPLFRTISLKLANASGIKVNNYLLDNDLYRLGGFSKLRGFDQQSVFATNYSIATVEIRLLFEQNSFLNVFWDQAYLERSTITNLNYEQTTTLGAGINFQTKPGVFSISYALGKFADTPFEFASAKIHFGFVNLF